MVVPRILLVHEPPDGGVAQHVMQLALALPAEGFEVEVAGPPESVIADVVASAGIRVHPLPLIRSYRHPLTDALAMRAIAALARARSVDVLHAHSSKAGALGRLAARRAGVPAVYTPHTMGFVGDVGWKRRLSATVIERALAPLASAIVCVADAERRDAIERRIASPQRLHTIHNGVPDPDPSVMAEPSIAQLRSRGPVVGAVNRLGRPKRVDLLLDAIPAVWRAAPAAQFVIAGAGPLEHSLHQHARELGVLKDERLRFVPFEPPVQRYLEALDVFVLASDWEGLPLTVLEAMACGLPQVVTDVGGIAEAVDERIGRVVAPRDARALAAALIELLNDEAGRRRMADAARARHAERFSERRMIEQTAALYRAVLQQRRGD